MRRILRKIASGDASNLGNVIILLKPDIVKSVKKGAFVKKR